MSPIEIIIAKGGDGIEPDLTIESFAIPLFRCLKPAKVVAKGGRLGGTATRQQAAEIATELERRGYTITGGGGRTAEEYLKPLAGGRRGGSCVDITATHPNYPTLRINTVDVLKDGITPTARELRNAARIRTQIGPGEHLILIPKN